MAASVRAFYSMRLENDPTLTKSFDLLYKGLEVTSGAQREHRYEQLEKQIKEKGFKTEPFESYLNFLNTVALRTVVSLLVQREF